MADGQELGAAAVGGVPLRESPLFIGHRLGHDEVGLVRNRLRLGLAVQRLRPDRLTPRRVKVLEPLTLGVLDGGGGGEARAVQGVGGGGIRWDVPSRRVGRRRLEPSGWVGGVWVDRAPEVPVHVPRDVDADVSRGSPSRGRRRMRCDRLRRAHACSSSHGRGRGIVSEASGRGDRGAHVDAGVKPGIEIAADVRAGL